MSQVGVEFGECLSALSRAYGELCFWTTTEKRQPFAASARNDGLKPMPTTSGGRFRSKFGQYPQIRRGATISYHFGRLVAPGENAVGVVRLRVLALFAFGADSSGREEEVGRSLSSGWTSSALLINRTNSSDSMVRVRSMTKLKALTGSIREFGFGAHYLHDFAGNFATLLLVLLLGRRLTFSARSSLEPGALLPAAAATSAANSSPVTLA